MAWTSQQQTAIEARGNGYIVSAAAGSGKTSVLVERLTRIISDKKNPVPVEKLIVVTFTVDAAAEMKQRLSSSLERAIVENPEDTWLMRQQMLLPSAQISTIHAFCFNLIREHMGDMEITSSFRVLDDSEHKLMTAEASDKALRKWHSERPDDMKMLWNAFCNKTDKPLEEVIDELHSFFGSIPFRDKWIEKALSMYKTPAKYNFYYQRFIESIRTEALSIRKLCDKASDLAAFIYDSNNNVLDWILTDYDAVSMLCKLLNEDEPNIKRIRQYAIDMLGLHKGHSYPRIRKKDILSSYKFDEVKEIRDRYKKRLEKLLENLITTLPYFESDMEEHIKLLPLLCELEKEMSDILWSMKAEKNVLSFDDGESIALDILSERNEKGNICPSDVARELSEYYELIMIDECQDSNNKQDYIFKLISKNSFEPETGLLKYGTNVFMVGDVKQCIYQFRNANPDNFSRAAKSAVPYCKDSKAPLNLIRLSKNFRSSSQVISFVNFLFSGIMTERCGEIPYTEEEWLYMGAERYNKLPLEQQAVEVIILPENDDAETDISAEYTADTISNMLKSGYPVLEKDGSVRPCRYDDFCILLRNKEPAKQYTRALAKRNIPAKGTDETGYLRSSEISLILDILRVLDNPLLEKPLAAVMLSPMFSFSAEDIAKVRIANKKLRLYSSMCKIINDNSCDEELAAKCKSLRDTINELRTDSALYPLEELIRKIYETTDFMSVMQLYQDGARKRANLQMLLTYARSYEKNSQGGVSGFLRYVDNMIENGKDFAQASSSDGSDSQVSIKTMHGSKGLEYPFVFICKTETKFSTLDNMKKLSCIDSGLAGMRLQNPDTLEKYQSLPHLIIQEEKKRQQKSEEMRLLYVGLTRARQKLFIPLRYGYKEKDNLPEYAQFLKDTDSIPESLALSANSMSDWIWMSLMHRNDKAFCELIPEALDTSSKGSSFPELNISYSSKYIGEPLEETLDKPMKAVSPETLSSIRKQINFEYSSKEQSQVSLMSVSAIAKADSPESLTLKRPRCVREERMALTGAEHGTAVHSFFQYAVFSKAETDPMSELHRLCNAGFISEIQMKTIRIEEIEPFFKSSIYYRIKKSDLVYREKKFLIRVSDLDIPESIDIEELKALSEYRSFDSMMKGIIDLAFFENDGFVLLDYKTDRASNEAELITKYRMQLYIYSLALKKISGKEVRECIIYSTHFSKEIRVTF